MDIKSYDLNGARECEVKADTGAKYYAVRVEAGDACSPGGSQEKPNQ